MFAGTSGSVPTTGDTQQQAIEQEAEKSCEEEVEEVQIEKEMPRLIVVKMKAEEGKGKELQQDIQVVKEVEVKVVKVEQKEEEEEVKRKELQDMQDVKDVPVVKVEGEDEKENAKEEGKEKEMGALQAANITSDIAITLYESSLPTVIITVLAVNAMFSDIMSLTG